MLGRTSTILAMVQDRHLDACWSIQAYSPGSLTSRNFTFSNQVVPEGKGNIIQRDHQADGHRWNDGAFNLFRALSLSCGLGISSSACLPCLPKPLKAWNAALFVHHDTRVATEIKMLISRACTARQLIVEAPTHKIQPMRGRGLGDGRQSPGLCSE